MKTIFKIELQILLLLAAFFVSCSKGPPVTGRGISLKDEVRGPLSGKEFIFDNLIWEWQPGANISGSVEIPDSHLFLNRRIEVTIVSTSETIHVPFYTVEAGLGAFPIPQNDGFIYDNVYFDSLFLFAIDTKSQQRIGTKVSIKVKIL